MKLDDQVDMIEFKTYGEIDLDDTPMIALACGHFFTAETLDGMIALTHVYDIDAATGKFLGCKDNLSRMAPAIPKCPHCQCPVRQYTTRRYNRLINLAVIDEMTRRFIVSGQSELHELEKKVVNVETQLDNSRFEVMMPNSLVCLTSRGLQAGADDQRTLIGRHRKVEQLRHAIINLQKRMADRHQPAHRLHEAVIHAARQNASLEDTLAAMTLQDVALYGERDHRVTLGSKWMEIKINYVSIEDQFRILSTTSSKDRVLAASLTFPGGAPQSRTNDFLKSCEDFISNCNKKTLPKLSVQTSLCYARVARFFETSGLSNDQDRKKASEYHAQAATLLNNAQKDCERGFHDSDQLSQAVEESLKLLRKEWYEEVKAEELDAIKRAMVGGPRGIATHSGHWYNCANNHPFAIGECGMPMELARCPECGARIGGQNHQTVEGVTRAEKMES